MNIVQSNPWEDEDKAMAAYLDEQDLLTAAIYDDPDEIARQEAIAEADWDTFIAEERKAAEEQYREWLLEQLADAGAAIKRNDDYAFITMTYDQAVTKEHAISMSAQELSQTAGEGDPLDTELHQAWSEDTEPPAPITLWHVQWRMKL